MTKRDTAVLVTTVVAWAAFVRWAPLTTTAQTLAIVIGFGMLGLVVAAWQESLQRRQARSAWLCRFRPHKPVQRSHAVRCERCNVRLRRVI